MKAGTNERITIERRNSGGSLVPGKVLADFSFPAWLDGVAETLIVSNFVEIGGGKYAVTLTMPAVLGRLRIDCLCSNPSTDDIDPNGYDDRVQNNDIDSVTINTNAASVVVTSGTRRKTPYTIEVFKGDGKNLKIPIYDDEGNPVDLTLWENFRFSIQNESQTVVSGQFPYHQSANISGGGDSYLTVVLPEDCQVYSSHPPGHKKSTAHWSADANLIAEGITKTQTLRAGPFVILSKETA